MSLRGTGRSSSMGSAAPLIPAWSDSFDLLLLLVSLTFCLGVASTPRILLESLRSLELELPSSSSDSDAELELGYSSLARFGVFPSVGEKGMEMLSADRAAAVSAAAAAGR